MNYDPNLHCIMPAGALKEIVKAYIPSELLPKTWTCNETEAIKVIEALYKHPETHWSIRRYGNEMELLDVLLRWKDCPGSRYSLNHIPLTGIFDISSAINMSLKGNSFIYKHDCFRVLQTLIPKSPLNRYENQLALYTIDMFVKKKERLVKKLHEMVSYTLQEQEEMEEIFERSVQVFEETTNFSADSYKVKHLSVSELFNYWCKKFLTTEENEDEARENDKRSYKELHYYLHKFTQLWPIKENVAMYNRIMLWTESMIDDIDAYTFASPLYSIDEETIKREDITVRLFSDTHHRYFMAHELLETMKREKMDVSGIEEEVSMMKRNGVLDFKDAFRKIGSQMTKLEIVLIPIPNTPDRVIPIPSCNGEGYCILAVDAFLELLKNLITFKKIFQKMKADEWMIVENFFTLLDKYFDCSSDGGGIYFIDKKDVEEIMALCNSYFNEKLGVSEEGLQDVRNVADSIISFEDVETELKRLNIKRALPEILSEAHTIREQIQLRAQFGDKRFAARNIYHLIEQCQVRCVLKRIPKLVQFIHNQQACHRIWCFQCPQCPPIINPVQLRLQTEDPRFSKTDFNECEESGTKESDIHYFPPENTQKTESNDPQESINGAEEKKLKSKKEAAKERRKKCINTLKLLKELKSEQESIKKTCDALVSESQQLEQRFKMQNMGDSKEKNRDATTTVDQAKCSAKQQKSKRNKSKSQNSTQSVSNQLKVSINQPNNSERKKNKRKKRGDDEILDLEIEIVGDKNQHQPAKSQEIPKEPEPSNSVKPSEKKKTKCCKCGKSKRTAQFIPPRSSTSQLTKSFEINIPGISKEMEEKLEQLYKTRDIIFMEKPMGKAKNIVDQLNLKMSCWNSTITFDDELILFHDELTFYLKTLEYSIRRIRESPEIQIDELPKLPEFPVFSDSVVELYRMFFGEDASDICKKLQYPEDDLQSKECAICFEIMLAKENTFQCSCPMRFHTECMKKWAEVKPTCPTCSVSLLDPINFTN